MITVNGRVVDDNGAPLGGVRVVAMGDWLLTTDKLSKPFITPSNTGQFTLNVANVEGVPSSFRVRFEDLIGRQVREDKELAGTIQNHDLNDVVVRHADKEGLEVTNLTGKARFVSEKNAVKLLIDGGEAFGRVIDDIKDAKVSVDMTQLFFDLPPDFKPNESDEEPHLIFKFSPAPLVPHDPLKQNEPPAVPRGVTSLTKDSRPERVIYDKVKADRTPVRILLWQHTLGWPEGIFWLGVFTLVAAGIAAGGVLGIAALIGVGLPFFPLLLVFFIGFTFIEFPLIKCLLEDTTHVDEAKHYFGFAAQSTPIIGEKILIRGFLQQAPDQGVLHCKMVITDKTRAVVIGSPFSQRYFDFFGHRIDDAHRGSNTGSMVHDLSMAVVGPAAQDLFETFRLYWDEDVPKPEQVQDEAVQPNPQSSGEDDIATVQVVRTLSGTRFKGLNKISEKGILEGYLRAFAAATHYIYLENQYFTDSVITDALVQALKTKPELELILVVPIKPDVPSYPRRSAWRIQQLRDAGAERVGVFTRWSYDEKPSRPLIAPIYIHAKGAVVDDSWATVGSANLDGLSLDYNLLLSPLAFGETMAAELNLNVLPPTRGAVTKFAELMRRRLFAEHLGLVDNNGVPNPNDSELNHGPEHKWLPLWRKHAVKALGHITQANHNPLPGFVLEYPKEDGGSLDTPRKHLAALGVELKPSIAIVRPLSTTRQFDFSKGKWSKMPELEDIKQ